MLTSKEYNIFLDDSRKPNDVFEQTNDPAYTHNRWIILKSHQQFVNYISNAYALEGKIPAIVSFDHDLHEEHYFITAKSKGKNFDYSHTEIETGYHSLIWLLKFIIEDDKKMPVCLVHENNNQYAKELMLGEIENNCKFDKQNNTEK